MRRIFKFRVWDIVNKEFCYAPTRQFLIGLDGILYDGNGRIYDECHVLQEFTGFFDMNGKDIYEGDVVKNKLGVFTVDFDRGSFWLISPRERSTIRASHMKGNLGVVIGHIFQDPKELLLAEADAVEWIETPTTIIKDAAQEYQRIIEEHMSCGGACGCAGLIDEKCQPPYIIPMEDLKGGRGQCKFCGKMENNCSYHEANVCELRIH